MVFRRAVPLALLVIFVITGCGGGGSSSKVTTKAPAVTVQTPASQSTDQSSIPTIKVLQRATNPYDYISVGTVGEIRREIASLSVKAKQLWIARKLMTLANGQCDGNSVLVDEDSASMLTKAWRLERLPGTAPTLDLAIAVVAGADDCEKAVYHYLKTSEPPGRYRVTTKVHRFDSTTVKVAKVKGLPDHFGFDGVYLEVDLAIAPVGFYQYGVATGEHWRCEPVTSATLVWRITCAYMPEGRDGLYSIKKGEAIPRITVRGADVE